MPWEREQWSRVVHGQVLDTHTHTIAHTERERDSYTCTQAHRAAQTETLVHRHTDRHMATMSSVLCPMWSVTSRSHELSRGGL
eukprot:1476267-Rhodomonas_salina.1